VSPPSFQNLVSFLNLMLRIFYFGHLAYSLHIGGGPLQSLIQHSHQCCFLRRGSQLYLLCLHLQDWIWLLNTWFANMLFFRFLKLFSLQFFYLIVLIINFQQTTFVNETVRPNTVKFFRTQSPRHFEGGDWNEGGSCKRDQPLSSKEVLRLKY
jgi:hypothetical protein